MKSTQQLIDEAVLEERMKCIETVKSFCPAPTLKEDRGDRGYACFKLIQRIVKGLEEQG